jgi:hypothetical protein
MVIAPELYGMPNLGPARVPAYVVGQLGRGRDVALVLLLHGKFARHLTVARQPNTSPNCSRGSPTRGAKYDRQCNPTPLHLTTLKNIILHHLAHDLRQRTELIE